MHTSETLAEVVKGLRASASETQAIFAERFPHARTYIANIEAGTFYPPPSFIDDLISQFPKHETRIRNAFAHSLKSRPQKAPRYATPPLQRQVDNYIRTGRFVYAKRAVMQGLADASDDRERQWMFERLHAILTGLGQDDAAITALRKALDAAVNAGLTEAEISCRIRLANRYQIPGNFKAAVKVLDAGACRHPDAARLWLQIGKTRWYEQAYSFAYAALTTALKHGSSRESVLHARGQVLAEWGSFDAALADIDDYLAFGDHRPTSEASVRSARAYIWGVTGRLDQALSEFEDITPLNPESAWLYYRRALCYWHVGDTKSAVRDLSKAVEMDSPKLNPPRYAHATALLDKYGITAAPSE